MRKCHIFFLSVAVGCFWVGMMLVHSGFLERSEEARVSHRREWVGKLGLSDLCLFTEARYTRHPVTADLHVPFQDYPLAFEHFPSGSILSVPPHLRGKPLW
ncbi:MAG: hypothetical protein HGB17_09640 [Syntrophobacteraceae bacterium]|nr:hypothetical protein [Syntrophobacteraceae bacterium]